jgi:transposase
MATKRRTYSREFKLAAIKLITERDCSVAEAARHLGISVNLLHLWKKTLQANEHAYPGEGSLPPLEEENRRLRAENKRLQMERDILKKATAFFASEAL